MRAPADNFFRRALRGSAPLMVWAAHFFLAYALVAAGCGTALEPALRAVLLGASALALATIAWPLRRRQRTASLLDAAALGSAVLALIGVLWTTVPMLWLPLCGS